MTVVFNRLSTVEMQSKNSYLFIKNPEFQDPSDSSEKGLECFVRGRKKTASRNNFTSPVWTCVVHIVGKQFLSIACIWMDTMSERKTEPKDG